MRSGNWHLDPTHDAGEGGADLVFEQDGRRVVVEVKSLAEGRVDRGLPLLAMGILQAKAYARQIHGAQPLAILWVRHATPSLTSRLRSFAENYAEGVPLGIVSQDGFRHFVGHPFEELNTQQTKERRRVGPSSAPVVNLFSDLNQWMLKILLAKEIPEDRLSAPRIDCQTGAQLAAAAGASAMSASRFLQQLRNEGFLEQDLKEPRLVRREQLFERWRAAVLRPAPELPMRFLLRAPARAQLKELLAKQSEKSCLGLFAAAGELKLGHVSGVPPHVIVHKLPQPGDPQWRGLRPAAHGDTPDLILRQTAFPKSTFAGAVQRDGWLTSDVIQTWLDVGSHPARGAEQADLIYARCLRRVVEQGSQ